ncbi:MAG: CDP-glycerol glycerophosphotransferase family protein [Acutalibacteraceae bacterium]
MEETLWQKLQRVKISDIGHIFLFLIALPVALIYRCFRKDLWLICDNKNEARDNGYWLFKYICENHKEQDIVYAISKKSPDYQKVRTLGKVVSYGSLKHWILYLTAKKNISSQKGGKPNAAVCYFLEVNRILKNTRIFLQHGVIKDDMPFLHYENTQMRMFVCSTEREWRFVSEKYGYPDGYVKKLGLCRFDMLHNVKTRPNQILVMPSWRSWIATPTSASYEIENVSDFRNTEYFKAWNEFLNNEEIHRILKENNLKMIFYPHRDMQAFLQYFNIDDENIITAKWPEYDVQQLLIESQYLITDYSSIAMDFAYMQKRLMYYQFDYEDFRRGQYPEGYFSYEKDGFGRVCYNTDEVVSEFKNAVSENFVNPDEYLTRHKNFFDLYDTHNCERNYNAIKEL